jgi:hypothetical protein
VGANACFKVFVPLFLKQTDTNKMLATTQIKEKPFNKIKDNLTFEGGSFIGDCHYWVQQSIDFLEASVKLLPVQSDVFQLKLIKNSGKQLYQIDGIILKQYFFFNLALLENKTFDLYYQNQVIGTVFNNRLRLHLEEDNVEFYFEGIIEPI